jgi:hypothetical protein
MDYALQDLAAKFVYRNPLDLPRISYADIVKNQAEGVYIEPPGARRRFYRKQPVFHDDPDGAGLFPLFQEVVVTYPPVFTVSLRDVRLVGFRSVLSREGFFVDDVGHLTPEDARNFAQGLSRSNEIIGLAPMASDGVFGHVRGGQSELSLEGPVVVLTSAEPGNFGSFLYRELVKLVNLIEIAPTWRFLNIGAAIGVSITSGLLAHNTQALHAEIGAYVAPFNRALQTGAVRRRLDPASTHGAALLDHIVNQQAQIIAYMDDYKLMIFTTLPALLLL